MPFSLSLNEDFSLSLQVSEPSLEVPTAESYAGLQQWWDSKASPGTVIEADASGNISISWNNSKSGGVKASQGTDLNVPDFTQYALSTPNPGLWFDGNDHLALASSVTLTGEFTILIVVERRQTTAADTIIGGNSGANHLRWNASSTTAFDVRINGATDTFTLPATAASAPHIITVTRNSSDEVKVWKAKTAATENGTPPSGAGDFVLTHIGSDNSAYHDGIISEIVIYNVELSDANREALADALADKWINAGLVADNVPSATANSFTVLQGGSFDTTGTDRLDSGYISLLGNCTGTQDAPITVTLVSGPSDHSSFTLNSDGTFDYTHDGVTGDDDSFVFRIADRDAQTSDATCTINVTPVSTLTPGYVRLPRDMAMGKVTTDTGGVPAFDASGGFTIEAVVWWDRSRSQSAYSRFIKHGHSDTYTPTGANMGWAIGTNKNNRFWEDVQGSPSRNGSNTIMPVLCEVKSGDSEREELVLWGNYMDNDYTARTRGWHHISMQVSATAFRVYWDGAKIGENLSPTYDLSKMSAMTENFALATGRYGSGNDEYDEDDNITPDIDVAFLRVYESTLTETQIQSSYSHWNNTGLRTVVGGAPARKFEWDGVTQCGDFNGGAGTGFLQDQVTTGAGGLHLKLFTQTGGLGNPWPAGTDGFQTKSGAVSITYPTDTATDIPTHPLCQVDGVTGAGDAPYYEIHLDEAATFDSGAGGTPEIDSGTLWLQGEFDPLLKPSTVYYLRARVREGPGGTPSAWTSTISFTTRAAKTWYCRPVTTTPYGTGDGESYANAWAGIEPSNSPSVWTQLSDGYTLMHHNAYYPQKVGPGDTIEFAGIHSESLFAVYCRGRSDAKITFTHFGANTGAIQAPSLTGFAGGPVYTKTTSDPNHLWWDSDADTFADTYLEENTATPTTPAAGEWGYSGGTLYVRLTGDADPSGNVVPSKLAVGLHVRAACKHIDFKMRIINVDRSTFEGDHSRSENGFVPTDLTFTSCIWRGIEDTQAVRLHVFNSPYTFTSCTFEYGENGIYAFSDGNFTTDTGTGESVGCDDATIDSCTFTKVGFPSTYTASANTADRHSVGWQHGSGVTVKDSTFTNAGGDPIEFWTATKTMSLWNNMLVENNLVDITGQDSTASSFQFGIGFSGGADDDVHGAPIVRGNVILNTDTTNSGQSHGIHCSNRSIEIYNNTIAWCGANDNDSAAINVSGTSAGTGTLKIKNNLIIQPNAACIRTDAASNWSTYEIDGNRYYHSTLDGNAPDGNPRFRANGSTGQTFASHQAAGYDTNGAGTTSTATLGVVDAAGSVEADTKLVAGSFAIDTAVDITTSQRATDRDGDTVTSSTADVGADEFVVTGFYIPHLLMLPSEPSYQSGFNVGSASANPQLWDGLRLLWLPCLGPQSQGTIYDLSGHCPGAEVSTANTLVYDRRESLWRLRSSTDVALRFTAGKPDFLALPIEVSKSVCIWAWADAAGTGDRFFPQHRISGAAQEGWNLYRRASLTRWQWHHDSQGGTDNQVNSTGTPTDSWDAICGTYRQSDGLSRVYRDGLFDASTTAVASAGGTYDQFRFSNLSTSHGFAMLAVWNRTLSPAEAMLVSSDPFALVR